MAGEKVITPVFRASFVHLFHRTKSDDGVESWSITMIFEPEDDLTPMIASVKKVLDTKFGANRTGKFKTPFRRGTAEEYDLKKYPEYEGKIIVPARAYNNPPGVCDSRLVPIIDQHEIYSGCYCRASVAAYAFDKKGSKGAAFGLQNVMKIRDGDRLVNVSTPEEDFADLAELPMPVGSNVDIFDL